MADMISPGVYTKIIDLSEYLTSTSGTIGFLPVITEKGPDNVLTRVTSYQDYIEKFGEPDIRTFGKYYGCGPYIAAQHLSVSSDLYVVRALPDDAVYAHTYMYFSTVPDYPLVYKFAKTYEKVICDMGDQVSVDLYKINPTKKAAALTDHAAYDSLGNVTNVSDAVVYTDKPNFAQKIIKLYQVEKGLSEQGIDSKQLAALEDSACDCYSADDSVLAKVKMPEQEEGETEEDYNARKNEVAGTIDFVSVEDYKQADTDIQDVPCPDAMEGAELPDPAMTVVKEFEPTSSSGDYNVGYDKISGVHRDWYDGKHTALSAISIIPGMNYEIQSDITCNKQSKSNFAHAYTIDPAKVTSAIQVRCGYDANGLVVLDPAKANLVKYTDRVEFSIPDPESGDTEDKPTLIVLNYTVDPSPWYIIDPDKIADAIANYDAYDEFGWLTNDETKAQFCGYKNYALKDDATQELKTEDEVALKKPATKRFVVDGENMLYVMDRGTKNFEANAEEAIARGAAWDKNGMPSLTTKDVWVTSIDTFAKTAKSPKMKNTQLLESLFFGNDTLILGAIKNAEGDPIYSENKRLAHNCMLGYVRAVGRGSYYNIYSIKITSDANPASFGTYKFQVFELQDGADVLCESYNVSFDPTALDADGESMYWVDVINKYSSRIVVEANENSVDLFTTQIQKFYQNDPTIAETAENETFEVSVIIDGQTKFFNVPLVGKFPSLVPEFISDELDERYDHVINADMNAFFDEMKAELSKDTTGFGQAVAESFAYGLKAKLLWEAYYAKAWAQKATYDANKKYEEALALDPSDSTKSYQIEVAIDEMNIAQQMTADAEEIFTWASTRNLMNMSDSDPVAAGEQTFYLENGSLGSLITDKKLVNPQIGDQILSFAYTGLLKNPVIAKNVDESTGNVRYKQQYTDNVYDLDWIYFTLVYDPGYKPDVKQAALELVDTYRRDCVLISDCGDNADYEDCLKYVGAVKGASDCRIWNTYLAARYEPYSRVYDKFTAKDIWVSPVYHMAKLIPQMDSLYNLWNAAAGFTRGVCSDIKELRYSPNKAQRDLLYMAQVNPIVHFPEGMTVWGNLTTQKKTSTLSDLNCVRCVLYIKRALEQYCRNYIFEMNDQATWDSIYGGISPFLDTVQANGGIQSYSLEVGATDYELKTKTCHVNVTLVPTKILEKIELNLYIK